MERAEQCKETKINTIRNSYTQEQHCQQPQTGTQQVSVVSSVLCRDEKLQVFPGFLSKSFSSGAGDVNAHVAISNNRCVCVCVSVTFDHKVNSRFMSRPFGKKDAPFLCVGLVEIQNTITSPAWTLKFLLCKYHRMLKLNFFSSINRNKYAFGWRIVYEENFFLCNLFVCARLLHWSPDLKMGLIFLI